MVWHYCPKAIFASVEVVELCANLGAETLLAVLRGMGFTTGACTELQLQLEDQQWVKNLKKCHCRAERKEEKL